MEYDEILKLKEKDGINPVLALAVDDLTENVFIITEDFSHLHVMYNLDTQKPLQIMSYNFVFSVSIFRIPKVKK